MIKKTKIYKGGAKSQTPKEKKPSLLSRAISAFKTGVTQKKKN